MKAGFYKNKRIFITGHNGFVGSWLTLWLDKVGADITGFSLSPPSKPCHYDLLGLDKKINNIRGDVRKVADLTRAIREYEPQIIIHLAAQAILLKSYEDPVGTYSTNFIGTLNVLEAARKSSSTEAILNVTSDKVYENVKSRDPYKEKDKLGGYDPYSSSKACSELVTQAYRNSFLSGIGVATARAGNILGGGDWGAYRLMPDLMNSYLKGNKVIVRNPDAIRPWTYILDVLNGYLVLTEKLYKNPKQYSEGWNFSSPYRKTVIDLIREFTKNYPINYKIIKAKDHEDKVLLLDAAKARKRLNWEPIMGFDETVRDTASWYNYFYKCHDKGIGDYSKQQLRQFEERLHA